MRYTFYFDDAAPDRSKLLQLTRSDLARNYVTYLESDMRPTRRAHVRVRIDTVDMEGRIESRDLSLNEFANDNLDEEVMVWAN